MAFATLSAATYGCTATMYTRWQAGTLKANLTAFCAACSNLFADDNPNDRTVGNWLTILQALTAQLVGNNTDPENIVDQCIQAAYRMFNQTDNRSVTNQISAAQAAAVLAAANANLS